MIGEKDYWNSGIELESLKDHQKTQKDHYWTFRSPVIQIYYWIRAQVSASLEQQNKDTDSIRLK